MPKFRLDITVDVKADNQEAAWLIVQNAAQQHLQVDGIRLIEVSEPDEWIRKARVPAKRA